MDSAPDISEQWFARYLAEHGHAGGDDPEPDVGVAKRPDFLVEKAGRASAPTRSSQIAVTTTTSTSPDSV